MATVRIDNTDSRVSTAGGWSSLRAAQLYQGEAFQTSQAGSRVTVRFVGTSIAIYGYVPGQTVAGGVKAPISGYYLDSSQMTLSIAGRVTDTEQYNYQYFRFQNLEAGEHTLTVESLAQDALFVIDYFEVSGVSSHPPASEIPVPPSSSTTTLVSTSQSSSSTSHTLLDNSSRAGESGSQSGFSSRGSTSTSGASPGPSLNLSRVDASVVVTVSNGSTYTIYYKPSDPAAEARNNPNDSPHAPEAVTNTISVGAVVGALLGALIFIAIVLLLLLYFRRKQRQKLPHKDKGFNKGRLDTLTESTHTGSISSTPVDSSPTTFQYTPEKTRPTAQTDINPPTSILGVLAPPPEDNRVLPVHDDQLEVHRKSSLIFRRNISVDLRRSHQTLQTLPQYDTSDRRASATDSTYSFAPPPAYQPPSGGTSGVRGK